MTEKETTSAKELETVRRFLQRNNLVDVVDLIQKAQAHSAKAQRGAQAVPTNDQTTASFDGTEWDSDGYFDPDYPTRLTVPTGLGGRYFIQIAVRWLNDSGETTAPDSFYYTYISTNGSMDPAGNDARSTANDTEGGATGTTQHLTYETDLEAGDFIELRLWQGFNGERRCDLYFQMRRVGG